ncbi:MAG: type VI secretion system baseplate subunit TssE [Pigmentiphaga sp.]|uniref:type VI secretion system baseplate subunit TssE n=1 Tax=Pigmentiphaga sp. TaxID=1977564 RepID=UPI0029A2388B|nr:type VI secretion system baseplate subunit TssE [Pigmentiphaga sp.]MDX3905802.1 type VI secretion system baseplate subunit TssE [Pigmentiphaga sp.]
MPEEYAAADSALAQRPLRQARPERDRLQPALLDRLTDHAPWRAQDGLEDQAMSRAALRAAVLRDMRWLLNCVSFESAGSLSAFPNVRASTLNYGVRPLAGKRMSEIDWVDVEESISIAIRHFEPRILPESLEVRCVSETQILDHHNILSLEIKGRLWCVPYPLEILFRTDIDLESGHMSLQDLGGA